MWRFLFFFVMLATSCEENNKSEPVKNTAKQVPTDSIKTNVFSEYLPENWTNKYFDNGSYLTMETIATKAVDSVVVIKWGNNEFERIMPDSVLKTLLTRRLEYSRRNDKFIIMQYGCGMPCWAAVVLPLDKKSEIIQFDFPYDYDLKNDLVVYIDNSNSSNLLVENLITRKKQIIRLKPHCGTFSGSCIDSLSLGNGELYYEWDIDADERTKNSKKHRVKLNL